MKHHAEFVIPVQDFLRTNAMKETLVYRKELRNWIPECVAMSHVSNDCLPRNNP